MSLGFCAISVWPNNQRMKPGELLVGASITALGLFFAIATYLLPEASGYAEVGPKVFPVIVSAGLLVCGTLLLIEAARGGFSNVVEAPAQALSWRGFGWISVGVIAQMVTIGSIGFIPASTILFVSIARGFGSARVIRDGVIALILTTLLYLLFTQVMGLSLGPTPSSLLGRE